MGQFLDKADAVAVALELQIRIEGLAREDVFIAVGNRNEITDRRFKAGAGRATGGLKQDFEVDLDLTRPRVIIDIGVAEPAELAHPRFQSDVDQISPRTGHKQGQFGGILNDCDGRTFRRGLSGPC